MKTYDMMNNWGDSIRWFSLETNTVVGWKTPTPQIGDLLRVPMESGKIGIWEFIEVKRPGDPPDMFFGKIRPIRYEDEDAQTEI